ncbi:hypothetical protein BB559_003265 [Furculomyces boomerangus]|uniref:Uncharacterized protein n=1 Tax=Furculomyces boomerangus TaxID=61424 RepID=A0A2T9YMD4_9FUNG|nr:hypothetical protein BB559_003265 [Furculomyces boomerangus]
MVNPHKIYKPQFSVAGMTAERARFWVRSSAGWAGFAAVTVMLLVSQVPLVKKDILSKTPVIGDYWKVEEEYYTTSYFPNDLPTIEGVDPNHWLNHALSGELFLSSEEIFDHLYALGYLQRSNHLEKNSESTIPYSNLDHVTTKPGFLYGILDPKYLQTLLIKLLTSDYSVFYKNRFDLTNKNQQDLDSTLNDTAIIENFNTRIQEYQKIVEKVQTLLEILENSNFDCSEECVYELISFYAKLDTQIEIEKNSIYGDLTASSSLYLDKSVLKGHSLVNENQKDGYKEIVNDENEKTRARKTIDKGPTRRLIGIDARSSKILEKESFGVFIIPNKISHSINKKKIDRNETHKNNNEQTFTESWISFLKKYRISVSFSTTRLNNHKVSLQSINFVQESCKLLKKHLKHFSSIETPDTKNNLDLTNFRKVFLLVLKALAIKGNYSEIENLSTTFNNITSSDNYLFPFKNSENTDQSSHNFTTKKMSNEELVWSMNSLDSSVYLQSLRIAKKWDKEQWVYREFLERWKVNLENMQLEELEETNLSFKKIRWREGLIASQHIYALLSQNRVEEAYDSLMVNTTDLKIGYPAATFNAVIRGLFVFGNYDKAMDLFFKMEIRSSKKSEMNTYLIPRATQDTFGLVLQCQLLVLESELDKVDTNSKLNKQNIESIYKSITKVCEILSKRWEIQIPVTIKAALIQTFVQKMYYSDIMKEIEQSQPEKNVDNPNNTIYTSKNEFDPLDSSETDKLKSLDMAINILGSIGKSKSLRIEAGYLLEYSWVEQTLKKILGEIVTIGKNSENLFIKMGSAISNLLVPLNSPETSPLDIYRAIQWNTNLLTFVHNMIEENREKFGFYLSTKILNEFYGSLLDSKSHLTSEIMYSVFSFFANHTYPLLQKDFENHDKTDFDAPYWCLVLMAASTFHKKTEISSQIHSTTLLQKNKKHIKNNSPDKEHTFQYLTSLEIKKSILLVTKLWKLDLDSKNIDWRDIKNEKCMRLASNYINKELTRQGTKAIFNSYNGNLEFTRYRSATGFRNIKETNYFEQSHLMEESDEILSKRKLWNESAAYRSSKIVELCESKNLVQSWKHYSSMLTDNMIVSPIALEKLYFLIKEKKHEIPTTDIDINLEKIIGDDIPSMQNSFFGGVSPANLYNSSSPERNTIVAKEDAYGAEFFRKTESLVIIHYSETGKIVEACNRYNELVKKRFWPTPDASFAILRSLRKYPCSYKEFAGIIPKSLFVEKENFNTKNAKYSVKSNKGQNLNEPFSIEFVEEIIQLIDLTKDGNNLKLLFEFYFHKLNFKDQKLEYIYPSQINTKNENETILPPHIWSLGIKACINCGLERTVHEWITHYTTDLLPIYLDLSKKGKKQLWIYKNEMYSPYNTILESLVQPEYSWNHDKTKKPGADNMNTIENQGISKIFNAWSLVKLALKGIGDVSNFDTFRLLLLQLLNSNGDEFVKEYWESVNIQNFGNGSVTIQKYDPEKVKIHLLHGYLIDLTDKNEHLSGGHSDVVNLKLNDYSPKLILAESLFSHSLRIRDNKKSKSFGKDIIYRDEMVSSGINILSLIMVRIYLKEIFFGDTTIQGNAEIVEGFMFWVKSSLQNITELGVPNFNQIGGIMENDEIEYISKVINKEISLEFIKALKN